MPTDGRIVLVQQALRKGATIEEVFEATKIDPWFLDQIVLINEVAETVAARRRLDTRRCCSRRTTGSPTRRSAELRGFGEADVREVRHILGIRPVYKTVDTCAGEFPALTPYHYSSYDFETEVEPTSDARSSSSVRARTASARASSSTTRACTRRSRCPTPGFETIMINCNPETVSTDYDTSDRLYFEPLTLEDVLEVIHAESPGEAVGVVVQLGGQTPLELAKGLEAGRRADPRHEPDAIDLAEERGLFSEILDAAGPLAPKNGIASDLAGGGARRRGDRLPGDRAAELRARRPRHGDRLRPRVARGLLRAHRGCRGIVGPSTRCSSTGSSTTRSRSTSTRSTTAPTCTSAASWSTSRKPASTPATRAARCRPCTLGRAEVDREARGDPRDRRGSSACVA